MDGHKDVSENKEKPKTKIKYDLFYALKPFSPVYMFFGLLKLRTNGQKFKEISPYIKIYSFVLCFLLTVWQVIVIIERYKNVVGDRGNEAALLDLLSFVPPLFTASISILISASIGSEMIVKFYENLEKIDESLSISRMDVYKKLRIKHAVLQLCFLLFTLTGLFHDITKFWSATVLWYTVALIIDLICIEFVVYVSTMKMKLRLVNDKLKDFYSEMSHESVLISMSKISSIYRTSVSLYTHSGKPKKQNNDDPITHLTNIYEKIADNAYILNSFYGLPVSTILATLQYTCDFTYEYIHRFNEYFYRYFYWRLRRSPLL